MIPFLLLAGCEEPIEVLDESARGEFIMGGVISTDIVDPYSYGSRCAASGLIEVVLRTAGNEEMVITMAPIDPAQITEQTWFEDTGFDFTYLYDPINPGDWMVASEGWVEFDAFQQPGGRVIGVVDVWGEMMSAEDEVIEPEYHIHGNFNVPRQDTCE